MDGSISLGRAERKRLLEVYRRHPAPAVGKRAHIILLLADGHAWSRIVELLYCSRRTIARWKERYEAGGIEALCDERRGRRSPFGAWMMAAVAQWLTQKLPRDFGFLRSRWCCELVVILMLEFHEVQLSRETVRRWLHREKLVWRRPRPVVGPSDPHRKKKLQELRSLLAHLPPDEIALFQDEVDINTNPRSAACGWSAVSRPRFRRRAPTTSVIWLARSTGGPAI